MFARKVNPLIAILVCGVILEGTLACLVYSPERLLERTVISLSHRVSARHALDQDACLVAVLPAVGAVAVWLFFVMPPIPHWWPPATLVFSPFIPPRPAGHALTVA